MATQWTAARVLAAAQEWTWLPDEARRYASSELEIVGYPPYFAMPTQVRRTSSGLPFEELLDLARRIARNWGRQELFWWVAGDSKPADLEDRLDTLGAELIEETDILAIDLPQPIRYEGTPSELTVTRVNDERTVHHAELIVARAFDTEPTPEGLLPAAVENVAKTWRDRSGFRSIAYLDTQPVATGGCTIVGEVARLWGAGVLPEFRGRGAYRTVLRHRLELAQTLGATLGLTKGRAATSSPILRRAGFRRFGVERCYRLAL